MLMPWLPLALFLGASSVGRGSKPSLSSIGPWICLLLAEVLALRVLLLSCLWPLPLVMIMGPSFSVVLFGNFSARPCPCVWDALSGGKNLSFLGLTSSWCLVAQAWGSLEILCCCQWTSSHFAYRLLACHGRVLMLECWAVIVPWLV